MGNGTSMERSDQQLLADFTKNDSEGAFAELVKRHLDMVYGAAMRRTGDRQLSEEITQDVFTILARKAPSLLHHPVLSGWLHLSTVRECSHAHRTQQRRQLRMKKYQEIVHIDAETKSQSAIDEIKPILDEAISKLRPADRDLVVLHFLEGLSYREIATRVGKTTAAVQKQCSRALAKLSQLLTKRGTVISAVALTSGGSSLAAVAPPSLSATAIASSAINAAPHLGALAVFTHTIHTMAYAKTKLTAAIAVLAILPFGLEWRHQAKQSALKEENRTLRDRLEERALASNAPDRAKKSPRPNREPSPSDKIASLKTQVESIAQQLAEGKLSIEEYRLRLQMIGAELTPQELTPLLEILDTSEPKIAHLNRLLYGALRNHPQEVFAIAKRRGLLSKEAVVGPADNRQIAGALFWHLASNGDPTTAELVIEESGERRLLMSRAAQTMLSELGVAGSIKTLAAQESIFSNHSKYSAIAMITRNVATSGFEPVERLTRSVLEHIDAVGTSALGQPIEAMTKIDADKTLQFIEDMPPGTLRGIAANRFFSTIARKDSDQALDTFAQFPANEEETINILLGLQSAFLGTGEEELAKQCADMLVERGATP